MSHAGGIATQVEKHFFFFFFQVSRVIFKQSGFGANVRQALRVYEVFSPKSVPDPLMQHRITEPP